MVLADPGLAKGLVAVEGAGVMISGGSGVAGDGGWGAGAGGLGRGDGVGAYGKGDHHADADHADWKNNQ